MNHRNHRIWSSILLAGLLISAGQLPPEIMADRHMVRLDRLMSENRNHEAYRLTSEIAEFYEKHNLDLPHEFHFKQARIANSLGLLTEAIAALHTYLNKAGKEGSRYVDALQLLDRTEEELREAEAERKRIEAERKRAETIRGKIGDVVELVEIPRRVILKCLGSGREGSMPPGITGCAANQDRSATPCIAPATHFLPAKTQRTEQNYSRKSATSSSFHSLSHLFGGLEQAQSTLIEVLLKAGVDPMALAKYAVS